MGFKEQFNHRHPDSLAAKLRRKRFSVFLDLILPLQRPLKILDVGGTSDFWERTGIMSEGGDLSITLLNLEAEPTNYSSLVSLAGDARDLNRFSDGQFDIVFSNSMIEHMPSFADQQRCAQEMKRVGLRYFVQTPNRYFPIEPHFLYPYFQFYPAWLKAFLLRWVNIGWYPVASWEDAVETSGSVRLLTKRDMQRLFPGAAIVDEKFFGLVKSFTALGGW